jgi:hypothetical protein
MLLLKFFSLATNSVEAELMETSHRIQPQKTPGSMGQWVAGGMASAQK